MPADPSPAERREWAEGLLQGTTPGPWFAEDDLNHAYTPPVVEHWIVAKTDADLLDDLVCEVENAQDSVLIAAAPRLAAAVRDLADENERLRAWKAEALAVLAQWDEVHEALGSPGRLGQSKAVAAREESAALREALTEIARMSAAGGYDEDDGLIDCSWCGGVGSDECDDPIQCLDPSCNGEWCTCTACYGRGHSQVVW